MANALQAVLDKAARGREEAAEPRRRRSRAAPRAVSEAAPGTVPASAGPASARDTARDASGDVAGSASGAASGAAPAGFAPERKSAAPAATEAAPGASAGVSVGAGAAGEPAATRRPVREGKRFVGAHVEPEVARQLKMIAAEDDTTIQDLLEEALDLLFAKKGKATLAALARR